MATFTADQLKQKYNLKPAAAAAGVPVAPTTAAAGFTERVGADFGKRVENVEEVADKFGAGKTGIVGGALQVAGQAAGALGDATFEAAKSILPQPVKDAAKGVVGAVADTAPVQDFMKKYDAFKVLHPEAAANLEASGMLASIIPAGKGAELGAKAVGKAGAEAAGKTAQVAGDALAGTGRAMEGAGRAINNSAFTPNVAQAERILNYEAKTPFLKRVKDTVTGNVPANKPRLPGDTALEKGISGTERMVGVKAKREADKLWSEKIAPEVKASDAVMTRDELFAPAQALIDKTVSPTRKSALQDGFDALVEDYAGFDSFNLETAQALKRDLDKFTAQKQFKGKDVANAVKTLEHEMADAIRQKTYAALGNKKDYLDWANLSALEDVGVKAISEARLKGGFGGFWSAMWDMTTTPIKTIGGQTLYRVGNALEFSGEKGIKKFGDFLKSQGFGRD